jgi:hypothetical protein
MPCLLTTGGNAHEIKQASRRRLIRGRLECFYLRKLFPDRLLGIELAAANAMEIPFSVFIAIERLRELATINPLVVRHLFEDPCADFTIKRIVSYDDFVHFEAYGQCSARIRKNMPAIFFCME